MKLSKKIGLGETRMLILGAQILLGFQFRGVFSETFGELPAISRYLDATGLVLMILLVALLITPGPYHRIVAEGYDDQRVQRLTGIIACYALLPFAVALGIDVYITLERPLGLLERGGAPSRNRFGASSTTSAGTLAFDIITTAKPHFDRTRGRLCFLNVSIPALISFRAFRGLLSASGLNLRSRNRL
jgi:Family of unknown function (DUF6328)